MRATSSGVLRSFRHVHVAGFVEDGAEKLGGLFFGERRLQSCRSVPEMRAAARGRGRAAFAVTTSVDGRPERAIVGVRADSRSASTVVLPMPRGGTFSTRSRAMSSSGYMARRT